MRPAAAAAAPPPAAALPPPLPLLLLLLLCARPSSALSSRRRPLILLHDSYFGRDWLPTDTPYAAFENCPVQCAVTRNASLEERAAAVFYHTPWTSRAAEFPPLSPRRHPGAVWVWAATEAPGADAHGGDDAAAGRRPPAPSLDAVFNLSMTYQLNSDIVFDYGGYEPLPTPQREDAAAAAASAAAHDRAVARSFRTKSRLAAWTASHCETASRRETLVAALQRSVPVDVFGKCGGPLGVLAGAGHARHAADLGRRYVFYLALENRLCRDYITEKLWVDALLNGAIPVVLGGADPLGGDYARAAPPGSYVLAEAFGSGEALGAHLHAVASNATLFASYHAWRARHRLTFASGDWARSGEAEGRAGCRLCAWLHAHPPGGGGGARGAAARDSGGGRTLNLTRFWSEAASCRPPTHFGVRRGGGGGA